MWKLNRECGRQSYLQNRNITISCKLKKVYFKDLYCTNFVNIYVYDISKLISERCCMKGAVHHSDVC